MDAAVTVTAAVSVKTPSCWRYSEVTGGATRRREHGDWNRKTEKNAETKHGRHLEDWKELRRLRLVVLAARRTAMCLV